MQLGIPRPPYPGGRAAHGAVRRERVLLAAIVWIAAGLLMGPAAAWPALGQELPVNTGLPEREVVIMRGEEALARFTVELALTPQTQMIGLMGRPEVPPDRGMLFVWPVLSRYAMWMRNTLVPLDFLFVRPDGTIAGIVHNVPPCPPEGQGPCPSYMSPEPVNMVLEIAGGRSLELGLQPGDRMVLVPLEQ